MSPMKLVGSEALSTAFSPFTPVAPPADVLMLSQPGPGQLTDGSVDVGSAATARPPEVARWRRPFGRGMACGRGTVVPVGGLAAALPRDAGDPVDGVLNGPLSSEQPDGQPVAAEPANVGENCPRLDVVTALARAPAALAVAAPAVPPKALSSATGSDSNDSSATCLRMMLLCMPSPLTGSELMPAVAGFRPRENQRTVRASPEPGPGAGSIVPHQMPCWLHVGR